MGKKATWFDCSQEDVAAWKALCPPDEYRVLAPDQVPDVVPSGLLAKTDSVLVVASGLTDGGVVYMMNLHRVDYSDQAIDQEPFGFACLSDEKTTTSGVLIHHGGWDSRTTKPPQEFWTALTSSGIGNCYAISELPTNPCGRINELSVDSQEGAFQAVVEKLRRFFED